MRSWVEVFEDWIHGRGEVSLADLSEAQLVEVSTHIALMSAHLGRFQRLVTGEIVSRKAFVR